MSIITLLTDFGVADEYVGVMKGVILTVNPSATIVDISHHISPQNILQAAHMLKSASPFFPAGTIHVVVVDPGVGSNRAIVAVKIMGHIFLAPNNGVLTGVLKDVHADCMVHVENTQHFLENISRTFHGRDIFAPVAGHLSLGLDLQSLGAPLDSDLLVKQEFNEVCKTPQGALIGTIIAVDRFGNLITNIDIDSVVSMGADIVDSNMEIRLGNNKISGISGSYSSVENGKPLAVFSSRGYLEVAVNSGDAARQFKAGIGEKVTLSLPKPYGFQESYIDK
jgi:S-adenosylmethionine hydrolase